MTTLFSALDWRAMSQEARDLGLNNGVAVPGSVEMVAGWEQRSAEMRKRSLRISTCGMAARAQPDRFPQSGRAAPTLLFIHGGYWQARAKEVFTVFAEGPMTHGINVALIGYTLAPEATLDEIVAEIHAGIDFLTGQLPALGARCRRHRGVRLVRRRAPDLDGAVASEGEGGDGDLGIYDLEPIRHSYLNEKLRADEATCRRNSPMMQEGGPLKPLSLVVGSAELPLLRKQTADFAGHRARYGLPVTYEEIPDANHFTIMYEMMSPKGRITTLIRQLFERTTG